MKHALLIPLACVAACSSQAKEALADCPIDRAVYTQDSGTGVSAGFAKQRIRSSYSSDLVFFVRNGDRHYWFTLDMPNGYGGPYISPQRDPKLVKPSVNDEAPVDSLLQQTEPDEDGGLNIDFFEDGFVNLDRVPQAGDKAPSAIFSAQLGPHFHYGANGGIYTKDPEAQVSRQFWRLTECDKSPH